MCGKEPMDSVSDARRKGSSRRGLTVITLCLLKRGERSRRWSGWPTMSAMCACCVSPAISRLIRRCTHSTSRTCKPTNNESEQCSCKGMTLTTWSLTKAIMKINLKNMIECLHVWILFLIFASSNHICGWNKPLQQAAFFMPTTERNKPIPHRVEIRKRLQGLSIYEPDSS